ncbi:Uncharacterized integral membrane endopeptidase Bmul_2226 [hydrothermal vent metagenome]|uniref:Uncharacterized integral membrane endopeptidase Bmul_2226 n=1 Tax=hydrothermal vent metagenome TaxID=652676 RepID=A0A3B0YWW7_9ZZZZ
MNNFTLLFVFSVFIAFFVQLWLSKRHLHHVQQHKNRVPEAFSQSVTLEAHQKAAEYTLTKTRFGLFELTLGTLLLFLWTLGGGLEFIDQQVRSLGFDQIWSGVIFIFGISILMAIIDLPSGLYQTFKIEQRFGFNRITFKLFLSDAAKGLLLSLLIGLPLLWAVLWLMDNSGELWWFYTWALWLSFSLTMMWLYPAVIAPLFNKFTPLEDETLRVRIEQLLKRCGFKSNGIFVMDGSTRSSHGNAYFTGLGGNKRIVFFDTLLKSLNHDQIEAVLAHELGHFKHRHVTKRLVTMAISSLLGLALLGWLIQQTWFFHGLGISTPSTYTALMLFMLALPSFTFFMAPISSLMMRKHEFEADAFAAQQCDPEHLVSALVALYNDNANTLTPDLLYAGFHYSHPPAAIRIQHLRAAV